MGDLPSSIESLGSSPRQLSPGAKHQEEEMLRHEIEQTPDLIQMKR